MLTIPFSLQPLNKGDISPPCVQRAQNTLRWNFLFFPIDIGSWSGHTCSTSIAHRFSSPPPFIISPKRVFVRLSVACGWYDSKFNITQLGLSVTTGIISISNTIQCQKIRIKSLQSIFCQINIFIIYFKGAVSGSASRSRMYRTPAAGAWLTYLPLLILYAGRETCSNSTFLFLFAIFLVSIN